VCFALKRKGLKSSYCLFPICGGSRFTDKDSTETLKGTALDIYRFMLKSNKPVGVRELARALALSSPSVAQHHLTRLEGMGFVKREWGNFVVNRVVLENCVKISRFLIPRYFFYLLFSIVVLVLELTVLYPVILFQAYVFAVSSQVLVVAIFAYETIKIWRKGSL
jgi:DNA-binding transcriptional ArsR family regulator